MTYYTEIRKSNISFYFNEKKTQWYDPKYCPNDPLRMTGKKDAAKTSVVPLKQRPNAYLPVCQEGLLNGGRRVEPAGPAWRPRDSIAERKFMTDDSVVLLLAVLCWFESNTPKKERYHTQITGCQWLKGVTIFRYSLNRLLTCGVVGGGKRRLVTRGKGLPLEDLRVQLCRTITWTIKVQMSLLDST